MSLMKLCQPTLISLLFVVLQDTPIAMEAMVTKRTVTVEAVVTITLEVETIAIEKDTGS